MTPAVVCIGAVSFDLITVVEEPLGDDMRVIASDASIGSGGPAATAAVALARLGVPVAFVGTIGDDEAGTFVRRELEREGVDVSWLRQIAGRSGMSVILVGAENGHRSIASYYGTVGEPTIGHDAARMARQARWVHVDHVGWAAVRPLRDAGVTTPISVDHGNPTPGLDLSLVSLYAPTERKLREMYPDGDLGDAMSDAIQAGPDVVAVTRGSRGAAALSRADEDRGGALIEAPSLSVSIRSTLGAGDVFHGALLASLVRGENLAMALREANACAALSCRELDGRSGIPDLAELEMFLATQDDEIPPAYPGTQAARG